MVQRMAQTPRERAALSRLRQLLNEAGLLRGNCVERKHTCGREACRCGSSKRHWHLSWYVTQSRNGKLRTKFVPLRRRAEVEQWVRRYQEARRLLQVVGDASWDRINP